jgi:hypothetical protein
LKIILENIPMTNMDNQPSLDQRQLIQHLPELTKLIDKNLDAEQYIKELLKIDRNELKVFGFTDAVMAEAEAGIALSENDIAPKNVIIAELKRQLDVLGSKHEDEIKVLNDQIIEKEHT